MFILLEYLKNMILSTPFSYYQVFTIEEKYGFNKTTLKTFVYDKLKGFGLLIVFGPIILYLILWVIEWGGEYFYIYVIFHKLILQFQIGHASCAISDVHFYLDISELHRSAF